LAVHTASVGDDNRDRSVLYSCRPQHLRSPQNPAGTFRAGAHNTTPGHRAETKVKPTCGNRVKKAMPFGITEL